MTNDEYRQLVEFLTRQFTAVEGRFAAVDRRFDAIDRRFDAIETRLDAHDERFREVLGYLENIYGRLERLEQEYHAIIEGLRRIEATLVDERIRREALERGLAALRDRVALLQLRIDEVERRLQSQR
jgi:predicted  nucleic acid-binding Zn-ribbon protein